MPIDKFYIKTQLVSLMKKRVIGVFVALLVFGLALALIQTLHFGSITGAVVAEYFPQSRGVSFFVIGAGLLFVFYLAIKIYNWFLVERVRDELV